MVSQFSTALLNISQGKGRVKATELDNSKGFMHYRHRYLPYYVRIVNITYCWFYFYLGIVLNRLSFSNAASQLIKNNYYWHLPPS